ncbi:heavy metal-associated isoprenylated plant protein 37-like [Phalaenopsis equestris]|uniref:heavy metal-associated isoprenylated plant protein 37-like n=1 Tax=Phalaenopsis equestris TaxID=78828 RepID=UPI0009E59C65|nr:heavy metal-associated isoprenylated plant protein 37-like [Phalaenopsis equestris]
MTKPEDFKLLKIQTIVLKVNIHCDGCKHKVRKLLQKIEGVYTVNINVESQKVTVSGNVDSAALIRKLARSGKHAELCSQKQNVQNQKHKQNWQPKASPSNKEGNKSNKEHGKPGLMHGLKDLKNHHSLPAVFSSDDDDDDFDYEDDFFDDEEEQGDLSIMEKINQLNLTKQANNSATAAATGKKNGNGGGNVNGSNGGGKKNGGMNPNLKIPNDSQPEGFNTQANINSKMGIPAANVFSGKDQKRMAMINNNNGMMGMGFQGLGNNMQVRSSNISGFGFSQHQQAPMTGGMHGHQTSQPPMMMNMRGPCNNNGMMMMGHDNRYKQHQQPQMMYNKSPQITPYTEYYYQRYPSPYYLQNQKETSDFGVHLFNDENTSSCAIM